MVRFSCFSTPVNKSKKVAAQRSIVALQPDYPGSTKDQSIKLGSVKSNPMLNNYNSSCNFVEESTSPHSQQDFWKSDGLHGKLSEDNREMLQTVLIRSRSLGNILEKESGYSGNYITEDNYIDHEISFDLSNGWNMKEVRESSDDNTNSTENFHHENEREKYKNQQKENEMIKSNDVLTDPKHYESLFSVELLEQLDRDIVEQAANDVADSGCFSGNIPTLARSYSVANLIVSNKPSKSAISHVRIFRRSRSFSDLNNSSALELGLQNGENSFNSGGTVEKNIIVSCSKHLDSNRKVPCYDDTEEGGLNLVRGGIIKDHDSDSKCLSMKLDKDYKAVSNYLQYNDNAADILRKPEANDKESSHYNWDQLTPEEFSMRRVESWISQIDIHTDLIVEEQGESSTSVSKEEPQVLSGAVPSKPDTRSRLAMEVAYNYISSLSSSSSSAQMANLGLVTVPILSPFVSLRVLNLSGNGLVHITPGSLPKGLHMLNLSKNNLSAIEGLRDLTHLRVLDLNYNRIARIGHGLASCCTIKELYLAGNKISEVEGIHRLLKLNILDLRFNKISTAKGLGQLAANYGSLQAINLEGNPAQKNVGDDQLKKFLLGLLPNLVYYNKQAIRIGSKEISCRAERAVASPQFDRGIRNEHKLSRRGSHGSNLHQLASNHGQQIVGIAPSRKPSKERHVRLQLPPASSKLTKLRSDTGKTPLGLSARDAMKRSRSIEGLGDFFKS